MSKPPLFSFIRSPDFVLRDPPATLKTADYDLLRITVEDFRFVTREISENLDEVAADVRARSTILRRLLCEQDLFNIGRLLRPENGLRVRARMLDFEPLHPAFLITCGDYPWRDDRIAGMAAQFSIEGIDHVDGPLWTYRENADVTLSEYLDGLAIGVLGVRVRRREVIKYVADKKAAHVSDRRTRLVEQALDRAWSSLFLKIATSDGRQVQLNCAYLEALSVIKALSESVSIKNYIDRLSEWLSTGEPKFPDDVRTQRFQLKIDPRRGIGTSRARPTS